MILQPARRASAAVDDVDTAGALPHQPPGRRMTGTPVQPNKAIVGAQRLPPPVRHPPGRHAEDAQTYEIMTPDDIGPAARAEIVLGKLSGRHGFERAWTTWATS